MSSRKKSKSKGVGDTVAKITKATGIDRLVHAVVGEDCGCDERREKLNKLFPYAKEMDAAQMDLYRVHLEGWRSQVRIEVEQQKVMIDLLHQTTGNRIKLSRCSSCVKTNLTKLETIYKNSCDG